MCITTARSLLFVRIRVWISEECHTLAPNTPVFGHLAAWRRVYEFSKASIRTIAIAVCRAPKPQSYTSYCLQTVGISKYYYCNYIVLVCKRSYVHQNKESPINATSGLAGQRNKLHAVC